LTEVGITDVFELTPDRRDPREDRRKQEIPVAVDRRKGYRRRSEAALPLTSG